MSKLLKIVTGVAALAALTAGMAFAGQNAGAIGKLYWQVGTAKLAARDNTDCTPKFVITATGVKNIRGANCQVVVNGLGGNLPPSWQVQSGGCGDGAGALATARSGFPTGVTSAWAGGTGLADGQSSMYYNASNCLTPHGTGLIWLETAGTTGVNKTATTEYGLYTVTVDQSSGLCAGDCGDPVGPSGVCLNLYLKDPCPTTTTNGNFIQLLDGALAIDNCTVPAGFQNLTWNGGASGAQLCPGVTRIASSSWGKLKNA